MRGVAWAFGLTALVLVLLGVGLLAPSFAGLDPRAGLPQLRAGLDLVDGSIISYRLEVPQPEQAGSDACSRAAQVVALRLEAITTDVDVQCEQGRMRVTVASTDPAVVAAVRDRVGGGSAFEIRVIDDLAPLFESTRTLATGVERRREVVPGGPQYDKVTRTYLFAAGEDGRARLERTIAILPATQQKIVVGPHSDPDHPRSPLGWRSYAVGRDVPISAQMLSEVRLVHDEDGVPAVDVHFDSAGSAAFAELTARNLNRRLAILVDGVVVASPSIGERIDRGVARIYLAASHDARQVEQQLQDMVAMLEPGMVHHPLVLENVAVVGETARGPWYSQLRVVSSIAALLVVGVVVLGFTRFRATPSAVALPSAVVLGFAVLAIMQATVTLPLLWGALTVIGVLAGCSGILGERLRNRGPSSALRDVVVDVLLGPAACLGLVIAGSVLLASVTGPWRGFAFGLLVCAAAGIPVSAFWAFAASGRARTFEAAPPVDAQM